MMTDLQEQALAALVGFPLDGLPTVEVTLPLPPSVNKMYLAQAYFDTRAGTWRGRKVPHPDFTRWKEAARGTLAYEYRLHAQTGWAQAAHVGYIATVVTATHQSDTSNRLKAPEDALASILHFNDNKIDWFFVRRAVDRSQQRISVRLYLLS